MTHTKHLLLLLLLVGTSTAQRNSGLGNLLDTVREVVGNNQDVQDLVNVNVQDLVNGVLNGGFNNRRCPRRQPAMNSVCNLNSSVKCGYGKECCCGECDYSIVFTCFDGSWSAYNTDFCFRPPGSCDGGKVDGGWGDWRDEGSCSYGRQTQVRKCDSPKPANGGRDCYGDSRREVSCSQPVDGGWSDWYLSDLECRYGQRT